MKEVKVLKENSIYRMSDLILRKGVRWEKDRYHILNSPEYRNTILFDYLQSMNKEDDWSTLKSVVHDHSKRYSQPDAKELVIHLRLGDTMDLKDKFHPCNYKNSLRVYADLNLDIPSEITEATIVTALHFGSNELNKKFFYTRNAHEKSLEVLTALKRSLCDRGVRTKVQSSANIDEDFCYMANSNYFVKSYSAISNLIELCLSPSSLVCVPPKGQINTKFECV